MARQTLGAIALVLMFYFAAGRPAISWEREEGHIAMPTDLRNFRSSNFVEGEGTCWAILIAGSSGYGNCRHQILRNGGLAEENIVVFMYDDIASNPYNPRPGIVINSPNGGDVYAGVPKDYTGENVTVSNFLAVLLGNQSAISGGSGKVVDSGPNDHVFIFYSDHGGPGVLGMPTSPYLFADDLIEALQKKHDAASYKEMVIYVEACESGSIFEGLLPENLNIYVTTAANAEESSWGTYCPGMDPAPPAEYFTCLGDLYSVSWMEDRETNILEETLKDQYNIVKERTSDHETYVSGSHVMQYGDFNVSNEETYHYLGGDMIIKHDFSGYESNANFPKGLEYFKLGKKVSGVLQRDADLVFLWHKFQRALEGSREKLQAQEELTTAMSYRIHLDKTVSLIGKKLFGFEHGSHTTAESRPRGMPLVDNWMCLKSLVRIFELECGSLTQYGMKHMRAFANMCNAAIQELSFAEAAREVCAGSEMANIFSPFELGFSA